MADNDREQRPDADRSHALERSSEPTQAPADETRSGANAADVRPTAGEREGEAGAREGEADARPAADCDEAGIDGAPDPDDSFDRDGMLVIAAIFSLIGLAVFVEYFW